MNNDGKKLEVVPFDQIELSLKVEDITLDVVKGDTFSKQYVDFAKFADRVNEIKKAADTKIKELMAEEYHSSGDKVIDTEEVRFSFVAGGVSQRFDTARFKAEHPDLYEQYCVKSVTSDSLRVKVK